MSKKGTKSSDGTLIRGADGALYFVQDNADWAVRLPNSYTKAARKLLDDLGFVPQKGKLPAFHGSGLVNRKNAEDIFVELNQLASQFRLKKRPK